MTIEILILNNTIIYIVVYFRCVFVVAKAPIGSVMSVRLSAYVSGTPTERIPVKFGVGDSHENLLGNSIFGWNWTKLPGILHENVCTFCCCQRHKLAVKAVLCNNYCFFVGNGDMQRHNTPAHCWISMVTVCTKTRHDVALYVHCLRCVLVQSFAVWQ